MKAIYVSVWDGGVEVKTKCEFDTTTKEVSNVEVSMVEGLEICEDEYILLPDGTEIRDFITDDSENLTDDEIEKLRNILN